MNENQNIEWKENWRDEYLKWICGFANAMGGKLYIGMDDSGKVVGVADASKLLEDIPNKVRDVLGIVVDVNLLEENGQKYLEIDVPPYSNPINYKGQYHYRTGSTKQELKGTALNQFILQRTGKHWDEFPIERAQIEELSVNALNRFRKEAARSGRVDKGVLNDTTEHLLSDLRLIDDDTRHLTRAALLLFHPEPERFVNGAYIKIGFFRDDKGNLEFQDEIHGPLMEQVDKAIDLIKTKYLIYRISYEGISRRETPQFPLEALRESLMNSIAHKDYASAVPIQISVFPDHITFWNAGQLPENWTMERLFESHPSSPYNPLIANAFFRSGDIESWGRGYKRIMDAIEEYKLLPPILEMLNGLMITYYTDVRSQLAAQNVEEKYIPIIEYAVKNGSVTNSDVQNILGISKSTASRVFQQLTDWLDIQGTTGKGTYYIVKGSQRVHK
ncbi:ATP-binding protein [Odoribacter lunatus]|uniref:ATP-binding protein n=1 Tax=Odoribacter lunatus TaxID=2941335 RepID=UPI002040A0F4|nr:RNA-binding domain-containing protein [Odoribacter lunatus]